MIKLASGKVRKVPSSQVGADRYNFLSLGEAEPDLGVPSTNGSLLLSNVDGSRSWNTPINILTPIIATSNSASADRLSTPRTISLTGNVSGSASFDGSANITIDTVSDGTFSGVITHLGLNPTDGTNIDQIKIWTKSITLTTEWQDTGIKSTDLVSGTYAVQVYANDVSAGGVNVNEYYSGVMSWYSGDTNSNVELPSDEIQLHRAGASENGNLYLRTFRTLSTDLDNLKLQIYSNIANTSAANYVFKFRRLI